MLHRRYSVRIGERCDALFELLVFILEALDFLVVGLDALSEGLDGVWCGGHARLTGFAVVLRCFTGLS